MYWLFFLSQGCKDLLLMIIHSLRFVSLIQMKRQRYSEWLECSSAYTMWVVAVGTVAVVIGTTLYWLTRGPKSQIMAKYNYNKQSVLLPVSLICILWQFDCDRYATNWCKARSNILSDPGVNGPRNVRQDTYTRSWCPTCKWSGKPVHTVLRSKVFWFKSGPDNTRFTFIFMTLGGIHGIPHLHSVA